MEANAMQGYDRGEAEKYILRGLTKSDFKPFAGQAESLVKQAISLDFEYMRSAGVLEESGAMGGAYYDDDEAFEYIFDRMIRTRGLAEDDPKIGALAALVDQYMDLQQSYLERSGLMEWD